MNNRISFAAAALALPLASWASFAKEETISDVAAATSQEINPDAGKETAQEIDSEGLIADLAWILLLASLVTIIFKKLKQPVVLGYILAGFLASPKFAYLPSISNLPNIEFWAELGIIVIMFTLGLEFSFRKLMNAGGSAIITALVIITGMTFAGFGIGHLLNLNTINSIFLGGMISMSSTTIIIKSLGDLGLKQKKFASMVLAVLIIEDLFAVLMLVILSSLAVGSVEGSELILSVAKLLFFLIIWFVVGIYLLPQLFDRSRSYMNQETMLVVSMGLCFGMAIFSVACGFSMELGAFVTGSILAGTILAEKIEKSVQPIKDLFGSIFFISVGMMVDPVTIASYWSQILLLAAVVIVGMIIFGTSGMLLTGQSLRVAMESGFSLTQIGEFSFIIASLGMSLGVLDAQLYPIIVAVSVITIFTTPYFIKMADPAYRIVEKHLPGSLRFLIDRYSKQSADVNETRALWKAVLSRYIWRLLLYSVILTAIISISRIWLFPFMTGISASWGRLAATLITLGAMLPFLSALAFSSTKPDERMQLHSSASFYDVPLIGMKIVRYVVTLLFIVYFITVAYGHTIGWVAGAAFFLFVIIVASRKLKHRYEAIEDKFISNLNVRENTRLGINNNIVSDLHLAYIEAGPDSPFVGDRLQDSGLRRDYGVIVSSIQRGYSVLPLPSKDARIFPGDILGVIGTDDEIKKLNDDMEAYAKAAEKRAPYRPEVQLVSIRLADNSPFAGKTLQESRIREDYFAMVVKIMDSKGDYIPPMPGTVLHAGDTLWLVGDVEKIEKIR